MVILCASGVLILLNWVPSFCMYCILAYILAPKSCDAVHGLMYLLVLGQSNVTKVLPEEYWINLFVL